MHFSSALVSSFLFASAFLLNGVSAGNEAGIRITEDYGNFQSISATFNAPSFTNQSPCAANVAIVIDGSTCTNAWIVTGIAFSSDGQEQTYEPWYQWYPDDPQLTNVTISATDSIRMTIFAYSPSSATVMVENFSNQQSHIQQLSSSHGLCLADAQWILGAGDDVPNFGTLNFTDAEAVGTAGTQTPSDPNATPFNMQSGQVVVDSANGASWLVFQEPS